MSARTLQSRRDLFLHWSGCHILSVKINPSLQLDLFAPLITQTVSTVPLWYAACAEVTVRGGHRCPYLDCEA